MVKYEPGKYIQQMGRAIRQMSAEKTIYHAFPQVKAGDTLTADQAKVINDLRMLSVEALYREAKEQVQSLKRSLNTTYGHMHPAPATADAWAKGTHYKKPDTTVEMLESLAAASGSKSVAGIMNHTDKVRGFMYSVEQSFYSGYVYKVNNQWVSREILSNKLKEFYA